MTTAKKNVKIFILQGEYGKGYYGTNIYSFKVKLA